MKVKGDVRSRNDAVFIMLLFIYSLLVATYFVLRYQGAWLEADTRNFIALILDLLESKSLTPSEGGYKFGFNYPVLSAFLVQITALPADTLLTIIRPFFLTIIGPVTFVLYRLFLSNGLVAAIAVFLLFLQPEFLFVSLRGSHGIITWVLFVFSLFLLTMASTVFGKINRFGIYIGLFYLAAFGLIATNVFFSGTFFFCILISLLGGHVFNAVIKKDQQSSKGLKRLIYTLLSCSIITFIFVFYLYPPARQSVTQLNRIMDQSAAFLLDYEIVTNPYTENIPSLWINPGVYFGLTLANWMTLSTSFVMWLYYAFVLLIKREELPAEKLFLWFFYAAFAIQIFVSIGLDFAGVLSSNLQLRLFPGFTMLAIPFTAEAILKVLRGTRQKFPHTRFFLILAILTIIVWFSGASLLKTTNEPLVSNKWTFSSNSEEIALEWMHLEIKNAIVWVSFDDRLLQLSELLGYKYDNSFRFDLYELNDRTRYILLSELTQLLAKRTRQKIPDVFGDHRIYDNGDTAIYQIRPRTPHER